MMVERLHNAHLNRLAVEAKGLLHVDASMGVMKSVKWIYHNTIRPYLPRKIGVYNSVAAHKPRLFDLTDHEPDHKQDLVDAIKNATRPGDTVTEIGGGNGIATVTAARVVGEGGSVVTFEGSKPQAELLRETLKLNDVVDRVHCNCAVVGSDVDVWGEQIDTVSVADLPNSDVLVMDCEGAEESIINELQIEPRVIIVELHPHKGVDCDNLFSELKQRGYSSATGDEFEAGKWVVITAVHDQKS